MSEHRGAITHEGERYASPRRAIEYLEQAPPAPGQAVEVGPALHWARIPLPMELNHINVWLLRDGDGWTLVDTGMAEDVCREAWRQLDSQPLDGGRLRRIVITHDHPDHMGLSRWLQQRHGAELWMSAIGHGSTERLLRHGGDPDTRELGFAFLAAHGLELSADGRARVEASDPARWYGELPELGRALQDGDRVVTDGREWQVIETAGHCRGHLCLYDARAEILISGDQVLPTISPNVSVLASRPEADTLGEFLASLERLDRACAPETLVLPSHGRAFRGLHERIEVVRSHHLEQLEALREACRTPRCAHELLPVMYGRPLRGFHRFLALGETVAHLNHLWHAGELLRTVDAAGRIRFGAR